VVPISDIQMVRFTCSAMLGTVLGQHMSANDDMGKDVAVSGEECAVHFVAGGSLCGEVTMSCAMAGPVKAILKDFNDGHCSDAGESIKQIDTHSFLGVTVSAFVGNFAGNDGTVMDFTAFTEDLTAPAEKCAVHFVAGGALCGEASMSCALVSPVKAILKDFADGYCIDAGESIKQIDTHTFAGVTVSAFVGNFAGHIDEESKKLTWPSWPANPFHLPHCTLYNEADDYGIPCGEVTVPCQYVPLAKLLRPFKSGKCARAGYAVQTHAWTQTLPIFGDVLFTINSKTELPTQQCTVSLPAGLLCAELTSTCDLIPAMKDFVGFADGECSTDSFKLVPGTTGPLLEGITFSGFIDKTVDIPEVLGQTCSIFDEGDEFAIKAGIPCGEVTLDCSLVPHAKTVRATLKDGVCADAGYTVARTSLWERTLWVPLAGDIVFKVWDKAQTHQQILV